MIEAVSEFPRAKTLDAEQAVHQIDFVVEMIEQQTACVLPLVRWLVIREIEVEAHHIAEARWETGLVSLWTHFVPQPTDRTIVTTRMARSHGELLFFGEIERSFEPCHILPRNEKWFFAEDMFARREGQFNLLQVIFIWRANHDGVHLFLSQKRLERGILRTSDLFHRFRIWVPDAVGEEVLAVMFGMVLGMGATADYSHKMDHRGLLRVVGCAPICG